MNKKIYPLTLYYDASCPLCNLEMTNLMRRNEKGLLKFVNISAPTFEEQEAGIAKIDLMRVLHARQADGTIIHGVLPIQLAYAAVGLTWLTRLTDSPVLGPLIEWIYPHVAKHRQAISRALARPIEWLTIHRARRQQPPMCHSGTCRLYDQERSK